MTNSARATRFISGGLRRVELVNGLERIRLIAVKGTPRRSATAARPGFGSQVEVTQYYASLRRGDTPPTSVGGSFRGN
jgi:hypothetical protein